jgi:putative nucleotidyltransferase with HDIG domain
MKIENVRDFIKGIGDLPTLPTLYAQFRQKMSDPKASAADIAQIISMDQAVVSNILRVANSAFYGFTRRISSITHAIVIIGFNGIHHIVLNTTVLKLFKNNPAVYNFDMRRIWEHSLATAVIAKLIAGKVGYPSREEIFTAGLLHDIGKIVIYRYLPQEFVEIIKCTQEKNGLIKDAESEVIGVDHIDIGECLLLEWSFPETLVATTAYLYNPVLAKDKMRATSIVHIANVLARTLGIGSGGDNQIPPISKDAWEDLRLENDQIEDVVKNVQKEMESANIFTELIS